ncbi:MAG: twin-arginine translocation pathway signal protein, partial [Planctomycetota bacterium]
MNQHKIVLALAAMVTATLLSPAGFGRSVVGPEYFHSNLPTGLTRIWIGPEYWANPLQDWQINDGRIECVQSGGDRNVYLLTRSVNDRPGYLTMSVTLGQLNPSVKKLDEGFVGFKVGIQGQFDDYRDSAVRGAGLRAGLHTDGRLFIGKIDPSIPAIPGPFDDITLTLSASQTGQACTLSLTATDAAGKMLSQVSRNDVAFDWLTGGVALVCSRGKVKDTPGKRPAIDDGNWGMRAGTGRGGNVNFWFKDWRIDGSKVDVHPERAFGPILFSQYTLSDNILKLTAQMPPMGDSDAQAVALEKKGWLGWKKIGTAKIDPLACTATFKVENWNSKKNTPYRLVYPLCQTDGTNKDYYFEGTIRKEPTKELVVAAFTGNNDLGFPNSDFVSKVTAHNPDMLFFSGDQIYEGVGGYGIQVHPIKMACTDYLRKWYLYGWAYRDLLKDRPAIAIPDDHDVYHGNIWGAGGKATAKGVSGGEAQDSGGFKMPAAFVNVVQRTQTSHFPDPYNPAPVLQDIGVYYCNVNYAGVSFAVIEDRKFKSAPAPILPEAKIYNGWPQNPDFDAKSDADVPDAVLLGSRQLEFLNDWAGDWAEEVWMKTLLSQTIFANVATLP